MWRSSFCIWNCQQVQRQRMSCGSKYQLHIAREPYIFKHFIINQLRRTLVVQSESAHSWKLSYHHHHQSLNHKGRWGTADDFATSFLLFPYSPLALHSGPVHSLMLSFHLFLCLPCLLPPFTLVDRFDKASTAYGMEISAEKTKLMTNNTSCINTEIKVNGQKLETITSFKSWAHL